MSPPPTWQNVTAPDFASGASQGFSQFSTLLGNALDSMKAGGNGFDQAKSDMINHQAQIALAQFPNADAARAAIASGSLGGLDLTDQNVIRRLSPEVLKAMGPDAMALLSQQQTSAAKSASEFSQNQAIDNQGPALMKYFAAMGSSDPVVRAQAPTLLQGIDPTKIGAKNIQDIVSNAQTTDRNRISNDTSSQSLLETTTKYNTEQDAQPILADVLKAAPDYATALHTLSTHPGTANLKPQTYNYLVDQLKQHYSGPNGTLAGLPGSGATGGGETAPDVGGILTNGLPAVHDWVATHESQNRQFDKNGNPLLPSDWVGDTKDAPVGVMQIRPSTAKTVAEKNGITFDENRLRTDGNYNRQLGNLYLDSLIQKYGGGADGTAKGIAAYHAGPDNVDKAIAAAAAGGDATAWWNPAKNGYNGGKGHGFGQKSGDYAQAAIRDLSTSNPVGDAFSATDAIKKALNDDPLRPFVKDYMSRGWDDATNQAKVADDLVAKGGVFEGADKNRVLAKVTEIMAKAHTNAATAGSILARSSANATPNTYTFNRGDLLGGRTYNNDQASAFEDVVSKAGGRGMLDAQQTNTSRENTLNLVTQATQRAQAAQQHYRDLSRMKTMLPSLDTTQAYQDMQQANSELQALTESAKGLAAKPQAASPATRPALPAHHVSKAVSAIQRAALLAAVAGPSAPYVAMSGGGVK